MKFDLSRFALAGSVLFVILTAPDVLAEEGGAQENGAPPQPNIHRPVYSPDGERIAFMSDRFGEWELFVMSRDGQGVTRLTDHIGWDGYPSWSPDGTRIVFDRGDVEVTNPKYPFIIDLESGLTRQLAAFDNWISAGIWVSADKMIGFRERAPDGDRDLVWIDAASGETTPITDTPDIQEGDATLAADNVTLYFSSSRDGNSAIEVLNLESGARRHLIDGEDRIYGLALSPDGKHISYTDTPKGEENAEIYLYDIVATETTRLSHNDAWDHMAVWSPDGSMLLFTSYRSGREEPYLMNPESGETYRLSFE